eukprot:6176342-Pleurochrysis_carterae.AAC.1
MQQSTVFRSTLRRQRATLPTLLRCAAPPMSDQPVRGGTGALRGAIGWYGTERSSLAMALLRGRHGGRRAVREACRPTKSHTYSLVRESQTVLYVALIVRQQRRLLRISSTEYHYFSNNAFAPWDKLLPFCGKATHSSTGACTNEECVTE